MAKDTIKVTSLLPATPRDVYEAWLDSIVHARMTGGAASIDSSVGGRHSAWDGYIEGKTVELEPARRIVQTWRTTDFPADAEDSTIEIVLEAEDGQTRITIEHVDIPEGQGKGYESGWRDHYFRPMHEYFADRAADDAAPVTEAMPAAAYGAHAASGPSSEDVPTVKLGAMPKPPAAVKKASAAAARAPKKSPAKKPVAKKPAPKKNTKPAAKKATKPAVKKTAKAKKPAKVAKRSGATKVGLRKTAKKAAKSKARSPKRR